MNNWDELAGVLLNDVALDTAISKLAHEEVCAWHIKEPVRHFRRSALKADTHLIGRDLSKRV